MLVSEPDQGQRPSEQDQGKPEVIKILHKKYRIKSNWFPGGICWSRDFPAFPPLAYKPFTA